MANHLDQTWVAYAFERPRSPEEIERALGRVGEHYGSLFPEPLGRSHRGDRQIGMALWRRPDERLRWPLWHEGAEHALASTGPLIGRARLGAPTDLVDAAGYLAVRIAGAPGLAAQLDPPFVLSIYERGSGRLLIANDSVGTARLFEFEADGMTVWSNRLGALPIFAGRAPQADERAWLMFAATGWFQGEHTPIEGARQLAAASVVTAQRGPDGTVTITRERNLAAIAELVGPRKAALVESADAAAGAARRLATEVSATYSSPVDVDLSGGRDSRVSAAGAIAAGAEVQIRTKDIEAGEVAVVHRLLSAAPRRIDLRVEEDETEPPDTLGERLAALHLVHDGVRNPQSVLREPMDIPHRGPDGPVISGHGGEIGHGFYYSSRRELWGLRRGGRSALVERLVRNARKRHAAARDEAYDVYRDEVAATLAAGETVGVRGPALLDWYYLAQRLANRSGLTTSNGRWSACSTLEFIRACFDLKPEQRLSSLMHRLVTDRLLPAWAEIPYFEGGTGAAAEINRPRIWAKPRHADELGALISAEKSWHAMFSAAAVETAWEQARAGTVHPHWEGVFTRIAWRAGFERHLGVLGRAASAEPRQN